MSQSFFKSTINLRLRLPALASQCEVCHSWPARQVCGPCVARFSPQPARCKTCAIALPPDLSIGLRSAQNCCLDCIRQSPPLDATLAAVQYVYPWSSLVTRYKFGDRPGWATFFAELMLGCPGVRQALQGLQTGDLIVPVPLSAARLESRGFNQAWELASALSQQSGSAGRPDARLLLRVRDTRPQTDLQREGRMANVKGAFQVDPLRMAVLTTRRVVLVDDVMTSGASLFAAAAALRQAGAAHITGIVLARTPAS